jgi:hypothetical protein
VFGRPERRTALDTPQKKAIVGTCRPSRRFPSFPHTCLGCGGTAWYPRSLHLQFAKDPDLLPACSLCFFACLLRGHIEEVRLVDQTAEEQANDKQFTN